MDIVKTIGAKTYGGMTSVDFGGVYLNSISLQFHNGKEWIYDYTIYDRDCNFPMVIRKEYKCCVVNNVEELRAVGEKILAGDTSFLNRDIVVNTKKVDKARMVEIVRTNKNVIMAEESAYFDNTWYVVEVK